MIDGSDLLSLETGVRDYINEAQPKFWTREQVFRLINSEVQRLARKAIALEQGYLEREYTVSLTSATVALPVNHYRIRNLELYESNLWRPLRWIGPESRYVYQEGAVNAQLALAVRFSGTDLVLESGLGSATQLRMQYCRLPAAMRYENFTTGGTSTVVLGATASVLDDVYNGDRLLTISGAGAGQFTTITDYVGATKTATLSPALSTVDDSTFYSTVLPHPLDQFSELVMLGTAIRCLSRRRDSELIARLQEHYIMDMKDFEGSLAPRQSDQAARVTYIPNDDDTGE